MNVLFFVIKCESESLSNLELYKESEIFPAVLLQIYKGKILNNASNIIRRNQEFIEEESKIITELKIILDESQLFKKVK